MYLIIDRKHQQGFSLIEVLVAIFIMAIGLLGVASLQTVGLRQTLNSHLLTQASFQGNDMAERMRANLQGVKAGDYDSVTGGETNPNCLPNCTAAQLAQFDAWAWSQANKAILNDQGRNVVTSTVTTNNDGTFTIAIAWLEMAMPGEEDSNGDPVNSIANSYSIRVQPDFVP